MNCGRKRYPMGKAKRNKDQRAEQEFLQKQEEQERRAQKAEKHHKFLKIIAAVLSVILLTTGTVFLIHAFRDAGTVLRSTVVAKSKHYEVNAAMASYYLHNNYSTFRNESGSYVDSLFDSSLSLREQNYPTSSEDEEPITWFEYFMNATNRQIADYLVLAEKAYDSDAIDESRMEKILDHEINLLRRQAEDAGQSLNAYLKVQYGRGVREQDVRDALYLYYTANLYFTDYVNELTVTDEERLSEAKANRADYETASYYQYTVDAVYDVATATDADIQAAVRVAKQKADALASHHTEESFLAALKSLSGSDKSVEDALISDAAFSDSDDALLWVFDPARVSGDTTIVNGPENFTVYFVLTPSHRDLTESRSFRHIEFTLDTYGKMDVAKSKAEEVLSLIGSTGRDSMDILAGQYNEDILMNYPNQIASDLDPEIADWLFDPNRKNAETAVVTTRTAAHILFYDGIGLSAWEKRADDAVRTARSDAYLAVIREDYPIDFRNNGYNKIDI